MEFLVRIAAALPDDGRDAIVAAERRRSAELHDAGVLRRIWRLPGTTSNVGIWEARDATALHEALTSLPAYPWLTVEEVTPLAVHPFEASLQGSTDA